MPLFSLPQELQLLCFAYLRIAGPGALLNSLQTCKTLHAIALEVLYRDVSLKGYRKICRFCETLHKKVPTAIHVRTLAVDFDSIDDEDPDADFTTPVPDLPILAHCVQLHIHPADEVYDYPEGYIMSFSSILIWVANCPSLQMLRLVGMDDYVMSVDGEASWSLEDRDIQLPPNLNTLYLQSYYLYDMLETFWSVWDPLIRDLTIEVLDDHALSTERLPTSKPLARELRSLALCGSEINFEVDLVDDLPEYFPALYVLRVPLVPGQMHPHIHPHLEALDAIIPPFEEKDLLNSLLCAIEGDKFPTLRRLTLRGNEEYAHFLPILEDLDFARRCEARRICLTVHKHVSYYYGEDE